MSESSSGGRLARRRASRTAPRYLPSVSPLENKEMKAMTCSTVGESGSVNGYDDVMNIDQAEIPLREHFHEPRTEASCVRRPCSSARWPENLQARLQLGAVGVWREDRTDTMRCSGAEFQAA